MTKIIVIHGNYYLKITPVSRQTSMTDKKSIIRNR